MKIREKNGQKWNMSGALVLVLMLGMMLAACETTERTTNATEVEMQPYVMNHWDMNESRIDLSFLSEGPAGEDGYIRRDGEDLVTPDGEEIRFWGVNVTDWSPNSVGIPVQEDAAIWAESLARYGINMVRLHFIDFTAPRGIIAADRNDTRQLDPEQMDKLDRWIAELKERGIYIDLNLMVGRSFKEGDDVVDHELIGWGKYVSYFSPRLITLQKEYARQVLTHRNPYTGTTYANEPAVAIVEFVNENSMFHAWHSGSLHPPEEEGEGQGRNFSPLTPYYSDMLTQQFNDYLQQTRSEDELVLLREQAGVEEGEPVPRIRKTEATSDENSDEWFHATMEFYMETERSYFNEMESYLRDSLNVQSLLLGSNDFHQPNSMYPMVSTNSELDIIDGHDYWQHPNTQGVINTPMVNDPRFSTVMNLSRTALAGYPYIVSEVNNPFPNDYESESIPVLSSYGSFQDWSGIIYYTFELKEDHDWDPFVGDAFDISHNPVKMPQMAAGALIFRRGDISEANERVERTYTMEQVRESMRMSQDEGPYFTPGFPTDLVLEHKVRIGSMSGPETGEFTAPDEYPVVSDTDELSWYTPDGTNTGLVTIDAPRSQGLVGFIRAHGIPVQNLSADISNDFASITLSSLGDDPISSTSRLLLVTAGRVANTGMEWGEEGMRTTEDGGHPSLIEPIRGEITLRALEQATSVEAYPLDGAGRAIGEPIQATQGEDGWTLQIGKPATTWYEVIVQR